MKQIPSSLYDPRVSGVRANPYPHYSTLRENHPVYYNPALKKWMITRYDDVTKLMKDRKLSAQTATMRLPKNPALLWLVKPIASTLPHTMIYSDPPRHTVLRQIAAKFFTKQKIGEMESRIEEIAQRTLAEIKNPASFDLVSEFSFPFTARIIADLLGIPNDRLPFLGTHSTRIAKMVLGVSASPVTGLLAARSVASLIKYFRSLIQAKRAQPGNDLISALANSTEGPLSDDEIINLSVLLVIAGHETTKNLIGNSIYALLERPNLYDQLRANPETMEDAVEEFLRFDSSLQGVLRVTTDELELNGVKIPQGSPVLLMVGAANRDQTVFEQPDELRLARSPNAHCSFGAGVHFCLGAFLARLETRIGLNAILAKYPRLAQDGDDIEWATSITHRGLERLRLRSAP
jgi:cytochrome P450